MSILVSLLELSPVSSDERGGVFSVDGALAAACCLAGNCAGKSSEGYGCATAQAGSKSQTTAIIARFMELIVSQRLLTLAKTESPNGFLFLAFHLHLEFSIRRQRAADPKSCHSCKIGHGFGNQLGRKFGFRLYLYQKASKFHIVHGCPGAGYLEGNDQFPAVTFRACTPQAEILAGSFRRIYNG